MSDPTPLRPRKRAALPGWKETAQQLLQMDWKKSNARAGLRCLPGFAIILLIGLRTGHLAESAVAAAAAMSVGFGSFQRLRESRVRVMTFVSFAISLAALSGSLGSRSMWGVMAAAAMWAFVYGLLTAWEAGLSWIGLQCVIVAVISGGFPVRPEQALVRAGLTLGGALLQTGLIVAIWKVLGSPKEEPLGAPAATAVEPVTESHLAALRLHWSPRSPVGRYAFQLGFALLMAACVYRLLDVPNGYWVPMTAVIVLKPEFHQTFLRSIARLMGTMAGAVLATLLAATLRPSPLMLCALVVICAWGSYALLQVNYGLFAVCITAYVVFLLALLGLPESRVAMFRLLNTVLGGGIALLAYALPLPRSFDRVEESGG